jgi:hypothetical protein
VDGNVIFQKLVVEGVIGSIHTLLTPTRNPNGVILNRDRNACKNILSIMKEFLQTQTMKGEFNRKQIVN